MFGLDWDVGCLGCFFFVDYVGGMFMYLNYYDVMFVVVFCVLMDKIVVYKKCMGW